MAFKSIPDLAIEDFSYDPETGVICRITKGRGCKIGPVGVKDGNGYLRINYKRHSYGAHRFAWFLAHKEQPDIVDHINGNGMDNRLCNLRSVTHSQNSLNRKEPARGVAWQGGRWRAYIGSQSIYSGNNIMLAHYHRHMAVTATHSLPLPPPAE